MIIIIYHRMGLLFVTVTVRCLYIQVEEVKRRQHCLMFSSAGSQAQTYFVNFDTLADYQRWHRQASKVSKRRVWVCASVHASVFSLSGSLSPWPCALIRDRTLGLQLPSARWAVQSEAACLGTSDWLHRGRLSAVSSFDWTPYLYSHTSSV